MSHSRVLVPKSKHSSNTNGFKTKQIKPRAKRSRNGCFSCKRLKIKCNEDKPICEYCLQTKKECIYPDNVNAGEQQQQLVSLNNKPLQRLNSVSYQLDVSKLELKLLKFYIEFSGKFFAIAMNERFHKFWCDDIPKLWCCSDIIKNSIYSVSSAKLLSCYDPMVYEDVVFNNDGIAEYNNADGQLNLKKISIDYMNKTFELIDLYQLMIDDSNSKNIYDVEDIMGQLLIAKRLATGTRILLPEPKLGNEKIKDFAIMNVMNETYKFSKHFTKHVPILKLSNKYSDLFEPEIIPELDYNILYRKMELNFIKHLEVYVLQNVDTFDIKTILYNTAISYLENGCYSTMYYKYPIALFKSIIYMSGDMDFIKLLENEDHISLKVLYYACCLCSIFHYQLYERSGFFIEFINYYKAHCQRLFDGWEDSIDENIYGWVLGRTQSRFPFELEHIQSVGEPIGEYLVSGIEVIK